MTSDTVLTTPFAAVTHDYERLLGLGTDDPSPSLPGLDELCLVTAHALGAAQVEVAVREGDWVLAQAAGPGVDRETSGSWTLPLGIAEQVGAVLVVQGLPDGAGETHRSVAQAAATSAARIIEAALASEAIFDLREEAARAAQQLADAAGQLVHDLNNPLAAAAMSLEIAREEVEVGVVAQLLDRAVTSTDRMKRMVVDLLAFSSGPRQGGAASATLDAALKPLAELWNETVPGSLDVSGGDVEIPLAAGELEIVMVALLENVTKFAKEDEGARAQVCAVVLDETVVLTVADAGRGVPVADRERVFYPTLRLDRRIPGMGLGLATVRRLVRAGGGEVTLEDSPLGGVCVRLVFPSSERGA